MTWKLKKYCSFLTCCSAVDAMRPLVHRVNRNLAVRRSSTTQKHGLLELLTSYQVTKNSPNANMKDWALTWARGGTLGHLVKIALRLGAKVNASSMDFVCLTAALITTYLPENCQHMNDVLEHIWECIESPQRSRPFGVYRLLMILLRIKHFRRRAIESSFMIRLHVHYQTLKLDPLASQRSIENETSSAGDEDSDVPASFIHVSTSEEEITDDFLNEQSDEDKQSTIAVVPRLNFTWLKNAPLIASPSISRPIEASISIEQTSRTADEKATVSGRSAQAPPQSHRDSAKASRDVSSPPSTRPTARKAKGFFRKKKRDESTVCGGNGIQHVLHTLGFSETITLLGNLNDTSFTEKYDVLHDPVHEWRLKSFLEEKEIDARDREKAAILEIFLSLSPSMCPGRPLITLPKTIVDDVLHAVQSGTVDENRIRHCLAAYVEYTAPSIQSIRLRDSQLVKLTRNRNFAPDGDDVMIEMLIKEFQRTTSSRRPGEGEFHKLHLLLSVAADYFRMSPEPMKVVNSLVFELESSQKTFIRSAGHVAQWTKAHLYAFRSLLSFYDSIFQKYKSLRDQIIFDELVAKTMEMEWMLLMKELSEDLLCGRSFRWLLQNDRYALIVKTLSFFTSLLEHFSRHHVGKQTMQNRYLDDFDFLLTPRIGLVSVILESNDADNSIQEQALRLLKASCSLRRVSNITDSVGLESHLKLLIPHFLELFDNTTIANKQNLSILSLQLDAVTSIVSCGDVGMLTQILNSGLVERLINEVHEAMLDTPPSQRVHDNACYACSSQPPNTARSRQQPTTACKIETVELLSDTTSCDTEAEQLMLTFTMDLQFHERDEELEDAVSVTPPPSSNGSVIIHTTHSPYETRQDSDIQLFCEESTVDQLHDDVFSQELVETPVSSEMTEAEGWPSDLSMHGDVNEDQSRWERYQLEQKFKDGKISFNDLQNQLAAISAATTTDEESEEREKPGPPSVHSFPVPLLNFERLRAATSEATSAPVSAQTNNPPLEELPSHSILPRRSADAEKLPLESAISPLDFSPAHRRHVSMISDEFERQTTGLIVHDHALHLASVEFLIQLLLALDGYDDQSTVCVTNLITSISSVLHHDLNGLHFIPLVPKLLRRMHARGPAAFRMLRLLLQQLFEVDQYFSQERIFKGEAAHVKRCSLAKTGKGVPSTCVVKVIDSPRDFLRADASILNVYTEVSLMERVVKEPGFCQIYDYGIRADSAYIVMQDCRCSLKDWIDQFPVAHPWAIRLVLNIFITIAKTVERLHQKSIVHFDLKCSNILLKGGGTEDNGFWFPETENPQFEILLADFGVARCYEGTDLPGTVRDRYVDVLLLPGLRDVPRGTEYAKAPEMLLITNMNKCEYRNFDRRRVKGVGYPSDVWGLGCLLYELLTGQMLHFDTDWARFYTRVTQEMMPLFDDAKMLLLDKSYRFEIAELLRFILVRDPDWRPKIDAIIEKVERLLSRDVLPAYMPPPHLFPSHSAPVINETIPQKISVAEWARSQLSGETDFTLYLTNLRLNVSVLNGKLHGCRFQHFTEQITAMETMGVIFIEPSKEQLSTAFSEGPRSRMRRLCAHSRVEMLFMTASQSREPTALATVTNTIETWRTDRSRDSMVSLSTLHGFESSFFDFLLDMIMSIEGCQCLRAMSILKERVVQPVESLNRNCDLIE